MTIVDALRAAKPRLWDGRGKEAPPGKYEFICWAIPKNVSGCIAAENVIWQRLHPCLTLEGWLMHHGIKDITNRTMQAHRHAWLDQLIKEFS